MFNIKHSRVEALHLSISVLGLVGLSFNDAWLPHWYLKLSVALGLCFLLGIAIVGRDRRTYKFRLDSPRLAEFFYKWYTQEGRLILYCNDLDWLREWKRVVQALTLKAADGKLRLYLKALDPLAASLKEARAEVYLIPKELHSPHRFSISRVDNFERIICRNKVIESADTGSEQIEFISASSFSEPYLIAFANDALSICQKIQ
jgi:hypothetical protein